MKGLYAGYDRVIAPLEEQLQNQNDNLGNDLAPKDGQVMLRRIPIEWVDYLDADANDPIYGIDWGTFKPVFLTGENMRENGPHVVAGQETVYAVDIDTTMNYICYNRRPNLVLAKG